MDGVERINKTAGWDEWSGYINLQVGMDGVERINKTAGWDELRGYINLQVGMDGWRG